MRLIFPYENRLSEFGTIPTITFWLDVVSPTGPKSFLFLFDTGADITSMSASSAKKLGIDLNKCPREEMTGFEGTTVTVYRSKINILFGRKTFSVPCVFHPNEEVPLLLGRAGILNKFTITMNAKKKVATFQEI